jgi:lysophospholipase L1-like esterase
MMFAGMSPCLFLFLVLSLLKNIGTLAFPTSAVNDTHMVINDHIFRDAAVQLRILPLGASIVYGLKSSDGNGFRAALRKKLIDNGNPTVDYIGSNHCGTMTDNECEGWPGYTISQVAQKAELSIPSKPNLVLLHVGTNDAVQNLDIQHAGDRLGSLIDRLFDDVPGVTIVASTLLPNANPKIQANVQIYNSKIPDVVQRRQAAGKQIVYVDFSSSSFSLSDLSSDGTHPTDAGYIKMAEVWYQGIVAAKGRGWLSTKATRGHGVSNGASGESNNTSDTAPGATNGPVVEQKGLGTTYVPTVSTLLLFLLISLQMVF